jgi:hypothetical protein
MRLKPSAAALRDTGNLLPVRRVGEPQRVGRRILPGRWEHTVGEDVDTQVEFTRDHDQSCLSAARGVINDLVHPDVNQELGCRQNDGRKPGSP